jgi:hypothetical protein
LGTSTIVQAVAHNKFVFSVRLSSTSAVRRNSFGLDVIPDIKMMVTHNRILAELDFLMSKMHPEQVKLFVLRLRQNYSLHVLTLVNNDVQTRESVMILQARIRMHLQELNLSGNHLKEDASSPEF